MVNERRVDGSPLLPNHYSTSTPNYTPISRPRSHPQSTYIGNSVANGPGPDLPTLAPAQTQMRGAKEPKMYTMKRGCFFCFMCLFIFIGFALACGLAAGGFFYAKAYIFVPEVVKEEVCYNLIVPPIVSHEKLSADLILTNITIANNGMETKTVDEVKKNMAEFLYDALKSSQHFVDKRQRICGDVTLSLKNQYKEGSFMCHYGPGDFVVRSGDAKILKLEYKFPQERFVITYVQK